MKEYKEEILQEDITEKTMAQKVKKEVFDIVKIFVICLVVVYVITTFLFKPIRVEGDSMYPILEDTELGITNVFSAKFLDIDRGDVVIIYSQENDEYWVKRIVGLPNETIFCKNDQIYIDEKVLEEDYLDNDYVNSFRDNGQSFTQDFKEVKLGKDDYFLMGDNRIVSHDSRARGPFHRDEIVGKDALIIYPFNKIKVVSNGK